MFMDNKNFTAPQDNFVGNYIQFVSLHALIKKIENTRL